MRSALPLVILGAMGFAPVALAQEFVPPRFEGLEQQQLNLEQRQFDELETQRLRESARAAQPGVSPAEAALRQLEIEQEALRLQREGVERRAAVNRETAIREAKLPNRRIAPYSSLVVQYPERYALPAAPDGQYYARVDGRFVLVDGTSELVVRVLEPGPSDPRDDLPPEALPEINQGTTLKPGIANSLQPQRAGGASGCNSATGRTCAGAQPTPLSDSGSTNERR